MKYLILLLSIFSLSSYADLVNPSVAPPSTTTVNGFATFADSYGGSLLSPSMLLDSSLITGGFTGTLQPNVSGVAKTWSLPNASGQIMLRDAGQTFSTGYISEGVQWFNQTDTTKRLNFDVGTNFAAGDTATAVWTTNGCNGVRPCKIVFPNFDGSSNSVNLVRQVNPAIGKPILYYYTDFEDDGGGVPVVAPQFAGELRAYNNGDQLWTVDSTGVRVNITAATAVSVAFTDGDVARRVTISDTNVTATSKIMVSLKKPSSTGIDTDNGYIYSANVASTGAGTFNVLVSVTSIGGADVTENPPNETITLYYKVYQ